MTSLFERDNPGAAPACAFKIQHFNSLGVKAAKNIPKQPHRDYLKADILRKAVTMVS